MIVTTTIPVGSAKFLKDLMLQINPNLRFQIAVAPEFLRRGKSISDFLGMERIVVGIKDISVCEKIKEVYQPLIANGANLLFTSTEAAEIIKYTTDALITVRLSFINEIADLCEKIDGNIIEVSNILGMDKRIGPYFLDAAAGVGGGEFVEEAKMLLKVGKKYNVPMTLPQAAIEASIKRKKRMLARIRSASPTNLKGKNVALLGLTFKPETDDIRGSFGMEIIQDLSKKGIFIKAFDPKGSVNARAALTIKELKMVKFCEDAYKAASGSDLLIVSTDWDDFKQLDFERVGKLMTQKIIVDFQNSLDPNLLTAMGYKYVGIGRD
jgi:UDPglucose 6-dehydrogenase